MAQSPNVIFVGVPLRGGITDYIDHLERHLEGPFERIGFKSQYPFWFKKTDRGENAWISWWNPLTWVQVGNYIAVMAPRLVIFKYWHPLYAPAFGVIRRFAKYSSVVVIVDNVYPHESFPFQRMLARFVLVGPKEKRIPSLRRDVQEIQGLILGAE